VLVVALVSQKGGAGKTTLATNLAVLGERRGYPAVIFDLDPQASATTWGDARAGDAPDVVAAQPSRLPILLATAEQQGVRLAIIDTAPNADSAALVAAKAANLVLIPCRPSAFDINAIGASVRLAAQIAERPSFVVINAAPPRSAIADEAAATLAEAGVSVAPVRLYQRMAFVNPLAGGRSAIEWEPKGKAAAEISDLWDWLCKVAGVPARHQDSKTARKAANG